jgi:4-hydroxy-tetrahydrodipicolinate reductase
MTVKVVQWGTGTAGLRALKAILCNPALELVGLYVARPERAGRDAGSFVDLPNTGVKATNNLQELLDTPADCLCYMGSFATGGIKDIVPFLRAGRNVVTPTLFTLLTPAFAPKDDYDQVMSACLEGKSSFFSTGASPGWCTDYFPMSMLAIVDEIRQIRVQEIADYGSYPVVEVAKSWGFGAKPGEPIPIFTTGEVEKSWRSIPLDIARRLGVEIEEIQLVTDTALADRDIETAFYTIPKGTVASIRFEVQGMVKGKPFVILEHVNYCGGVIPAHWPRPNSGSMLVYRTEVVGRPNLQAEIALDYPVAAMRTVNAIPAIVAAPPGIVAGSDVPPLASGNVVLG